MAHALIVDDDMDVLGIGAARDDARERIDRAVPLARRL
jgi:hypothetical protein